METKYMIVQYELYNVNNFFAAKQRFGIFQCERMKLILYSDLVFNL